MRKDELGFDDGLVEFSINGGKAVITINPTDADFFGAVYQAFYDLSKKQEQSEEERKEMPQEKVFDFMREVSADMKAAIDQVFTPVSNVDSLCDAIFGKMNLYSYADGLPVWCNFLLAVMDKADASISQQRKLSDPRIQKYVAKYKR